jgi:hypothetical protein
MDELINIFDDETSAYDALSRLFEKIELATAADDWLARLFEDSTSPMATKDALFELRLAAE